MVKHTSLFFFHSLSTHFQIHPNLFLSSSHLEKRAKVGIYELMDLLNIWKITMIYIITLGLMTPCTFKKFLKSVHRWWNKGREWHKSPKKKIPVQFRTWFLIDLSTLDSLQKPGFFFPVLLFTKHLTSVFEHSVIQCVSTACWSVNPFTPNHFGVKWRLLLLSQ